MVSAEPGDSQVLGMCVWEGAMGDGVAFVGTKI